MMLPFCVPGVFGLFFRTPGIFYHTADDSLVYLAFRFIVPTDIRSIIVVCPSLWSLISFDKCSRLCGLTSHTRSERNKARDPRQ